MEKEMSPIISTYYLVAGVIALSLIIALMAIYAEFRNWVKWIRESHEQPLPHPDPTTLRRDEVDEEWEAFVGHSRFDEYGRDQS
jgi:predicted PurR-regulated permease PerM